MGTDEEKNNMSDDDRDDLAIRDEQVYDLDADLPSGADGSNTAALTALTGPSSAEKRLLGKILGELYLLRTFNTHDKRPAEPPAVIYGLLNGIERVIDAEAAGLIAETDYVAIEEMLSDVEKQYPEGPGGGAPIPAAVVQRYVDEEEVDTGIALAILAHTFGEGRYRSLIRRMEPPYGKIAADPNLAQALGLS
jgi:hypothetical protein